MSPAPIEVCTTAGISSWILVRVGEKSAKTSSLPKEKSGTYLHRPPPYPKKSKRQVCKVLTQGKVRDLSVKIFSHREKSGTRLKVTKPHPMASCSYWADGDVEASASSFRI